MTKLTTLLAFFIFHSTFCIAQAELGNWMMLFGTARLSEQWGAHYEAQARSYQVVPNMEQLLLRGGINYHLPSRWVVTAGYAHITNWSFDKVVAPDPTATENRIWEQALQRFTIGSVLCEQRYRLEQRWTDFQTQNVETDNGKPTYSDRLRIQLRVGIPIGADSMQAATFFVSFYDEFFSNAFPFSFDRNRLYGALGYQFNSWSNLQIGVMAQTTNSSTRTLLQLGLFLNPVIGH